MTLQAGGGPGERAPTPRWDLVAGGLSVLCAAHCAAAPLLVAITPALASGPVEAILSAGLVTLSAIVLVRGAARHQRWHTLLPLAMGLTALALLRAQDRCCGADPLPPAQLGLLVTSCVGFVGAHVLNARALRGCCAACPA